VWPGVETIVIDPSPKHVEVRVDLPHEVAAQPLAVRARVRRVALRVGREGGVELDLLDVEHRLGKHQRVPRVIGMAVRERHVLDLIRRQADRRELGEERLRAREHHSSTLLLAGRLGHDGIGHAGVPQKQAARGVQDDVAVVAQIDRFPDIPIRCPPRLVHAVDLAALEVPQAQHHLGALAAGACACPCKGRTDAAIARASAMGREYRLTSGRAFIGVLLD